MKVGDTIIWTNKLFYSKSIRTTIINKSYYDNFRECSIFPNLLLCGPKNETIYGMTAINLKKKRKLILLKYLFRQFLFNHIYYISNSLLFSYQLIDYTDYQLIYHLSELSSYKYIVAVLIIVLHLIYYIQYPS